jgi:hypothetical protein
MLHGMVTLVVVSILAGLVYVFKAVCPQGESNLGPFICIVLVLAILGLVIGWIWRH